MSRPKSASALAVLAGVSALAGCVERNQGISAVDVGIYFPAAMSLDPRVPETTPSRFLFVANANSNLEYNAGSLVAVDLDKFFHAWMNCAEHCFYGTGLEQCQTQVDARQAEQHFFAVMADRLAAEGKSDGAVEEQIAAAKAAEKQRRAEDPCGPSFLVRDVGEDVDPRFGWDAKADEPLDYEIFSPCRHVAFRPQVIECEDRAVLATATRGNLGGVEIDPGEPPVEPLSVRMGHFITDLAGWVSDPAADGAYLLATVKADPSITWVELGGGLVEPEEPATAGRAHAPFRPSHPELPTTLRFQCGQEGTSTAYESGLLFDKGRCARSGERSHALRFPYDNPDNPRIGPEPSNILVSKSQNWAYVTFASSPEVVLIDLAVPTSGKFEANPNPPDTTTGTTTDAPDTTTGTTTDATGTTTDATGTTADMTTGATTDATATGTTDGGATDTSGAPPPGPLPPAEGTSTKPMIVDARNIFLVGEAASGGGWGLAERPCLPGSAEVPGATTVPLVHGGAAVECARPLLYSSFRTGLYFARMLPDTVRPVPGQQHCIGDVYRDEQGDPLLDDEGNEIVVFSGDPGAVSCYPQIFFAGFTQAGGFATNSGQLGDIAFSRDGKRLFAVQSNPGALLFTDTSVDERGETRDEPAGLVELCNGPTRMTLFEDGANEYAAISCPGPSQVFVVDLSGFRVVANIAVGLGPHALVVDRARRVLYVGNTLDRTISVIDIAGDRSTRFAEIARVGLQQPYKR